MDQHNLPNTESYLKRLAGNSNVNSKFSSIDMADFHHIQTIGKEDQRKNQLCQNDSRIRYLLAGFALMVIAVLAIVLPIVFTRSNPITTTTTMEILFFPNNTGTSPSAITSLLTSSITNSPTSPAVTFTTTSNPCTASWAGIKMIANCVGCDPVPFYTAFVLNYTAIGSATRLAFSHRRETGYFAFDHLSGKSLTAPSVEILVNAGFETGDLTGWSYCSQDNSTDSGGSKWISSNFTYLGVPYSPNSGSHYYLAGGSLTNDYLSQTFPTVIGEVYNVSFWYTYFGNGSATRVDLFLGI